MKVPLRPGTKVLISGHPAVLTDDYQFDFDLPSLQAIGESLRNDSHNFGLNIHLHVEPESNAIEPWITYDEEPRPYDENMDRVRTPDPTSPLEDDVTEKPTKKVASKPVSGKAKPTAKKKGTKK